MLSAEAQWLGRALDHLPAERLSPIINLGSSTRTFREEGQPYISEFIIRPLEERGINIVHVDLEPGEGVDIAGDIFDPTVYKKICSYNPGAVICANILEHVERPERLAKVCVDMVREGGLIISSVPYSFPFHLAPIDTMFRPSIEELADIFSNCNTLSGEIVNCGTFGQQLSTSPNVLIKHIVRMAIPWPSFQHWKATMDRNKWLFREYRTSCVVLEKQ